MNQVLLLDAEQRSALAVTRSLGRRGVQVHAASAVPETLAGSSRYAVSRQQYPDPQLQPRQFVEWVHSTCASQGIERVFPLTDVTTMLLSPEAGAPRPPILLCAPRDSYEAVTDKARLAGIAQEVGVRIPATRICHSRSEIEAVLAAAEFPVVLKPARSRVLLDDRIVSTSVGIVKSMSAAQTYLDRQPWLASMPCLIQEFVPGHGAGIFALYGAGKPLAWFAHRRIREKPPQGGVSVLSESVGIDPKLQEAAERLLTRAQWDGAAMVEFRIGTDGTPYLMEINGRLWGSLQLAIDSGVDFPWLMFCASRGERVPVPQGYTIGRRLRWFMGDVDNLLLELRGHGLARSAGARVMAAARFLLSTMDPREHSEIFRLRDLGPAHFELRHWFAALGGKS